MEPNNWFRVRHSEPFSDDAFQAFNASCAIYRARIGAILEHWDDLPINKTVAKPIVNFFDPEISEDRRVMSLPIGVEGQTLGSRALLHGIAGVELHSDLPISLLGQVEVGLTEPSLTGDSKWRNDWWDPNNREKDTISGEEFLKRQNLAAGGKNSRGRT